MKPLGRCSVIRERVTNAIDNRRKRQMKRTKQDVEREMREMSEKMEELADELKDVDAAPIVVTAPKKGVVYNTETHVPEAGHACTLLFIGDNICEGYRNSGGDYREWPSNKGHSTNACPPPIRWIIKPNYTP